MEPAEQLRAVRRRMALSQRELAASSGVSARTIAAIESGQREPTFAVLRQVLAVAGLELTVDSAPPEVDEVGRRHLRRSLTERLHRALGGGGMPHRSRAPGPVWEQLVHLAANARVVLHGEVALAMWLPPPRPLSTAEVCVRLDSQRALPPVPDLRVRASCAGHAAAVVAATLESQRIGVDPPADLALVPEHGGDRPSLRAVARLLHADAARDGAGRRVRAHADPRHALERDRVFHTKRFGWRPMPEENDRRGWRLDDDASLDSWLRRYGYPV